MVKGVLPERLTGLVVPRRVSRGQRPEGDGTGLRPRLVCPVVYHGLNPPLTAEGVINPTGPHGPCPKETVAGTPGVDRPEYLLPLIRGT